MRDLLGRFRLGWRWVAAQFVGMLLVILIGLAWTRLPEKHVWQVLLSLLLPLLLVAAALVLQAGSIRRFADDDGKRVHLAWGALTLLFWAALVWVSWSILDWCDDRILDWASYLNSQAPAHWRAKIFTYQHIQQGLNFLEWLLRWFIVPGKVFPYAATSAQWGWRLHWRRALRLLWNWRWWAGVAVFSFLAVWLPGKLFSGEPHGAVSAQVWAVGLKLAGAYLLALSGWLLLLGWAAVLFNRQQPPADNAWDQQIFERLRASRRWIVASLGWLTLYVVADLIIDPLPDSQSWIKGIAALILVALAIVLVAGSMRSLMANHVKPVRMAWGTLLILLWALPAVGIAVLLSLWHLPALPWVIGWVLTPAVLLPFAAASSVWGLRLLPWRRTLRLLGSWRWWLGVASAAVVGVAFPSLIDAALLDGATPLSHWGIGLKDAVNASLAMGSWVLLLGWLGVLFGRLQPPPEEALQAVSLVPAPEAGTRSAVAEIPPGEDGSGA